MDVYAVLRGRRSVSELDGRTPSQPVIQRLLQAAVWAPNHHRTEPWRFAVIAGPARQAMGEAVARSLETSLDASSPAVAGEIKSCRARLLRAPVVIVVGQVVSADPVLALEDYAACCCATQNLLLAAHAEGLAAKWRTGEMAEYDAAKTFVGLRPADRIVAYVYLGYPAASVGPDDRTRPAPPIQWHGMDAADGGT
ncbi:MAG: nitroreductase [Actinobacteria bacterium]|nr:nitroreductase [Actinomycetota bacterium]